MTLLPLQRLGWSEGDAWTVGVGLAVSLTLAVTTIPAALDATGRAVRAQVPAFAAAVPPPAPADADLPAPAVVPPAPAPVVQPLLGPLLPAVDAPGAAPASSDAGVPAPAAPPPAAPVPAAPSLVPGQVALLSGVPSLPGAVAATPDGLVHAATDRPAADGGGPARVLTFDLLGARRADVAVPQQPADRSRGITGLAADPSGQLVAVDAATSRVLRYDPRARTFAVLAALPDLPPCLLPTATGCQPGVLDTAPLLRGVAVDRTGTVYVADAGQGLIWRLAAGAQPEVFFASADVAGEEGLAGLAPDAKGDLLAVVTRLGGLQGSGAGALLHIDVGEDGSAGDRSVVATFAVGEDPVDVAVAASGNLLVPLRGADALVVLDATGSEQLRIVEDLLQGPTAVELVAGRALLTVTGPKPAVLAVGTTDRP